MYINIYIRQQAAFKPAGGGNEWEQTEAWKLHFRRVLSIMCTVGAQRTITRYSGDANTPLTAALAALGGGGCNKTVGDDPRRPRLR